MARDPYRIATSELEDEFELELEGIEAGEYELELEADDEFDDEFEGPDELEVPDEEFEGLDDEFAQSGDRDPSGFADRLYELSLREFESEGDADNALREVLDDMEREYFFGGLKRLARRGLRSGLRQLAERAQRMAPGLPLGQAIQGLTKLASGNLKGSLAALAKSGLAAALRSHPAGLAALSSLQALGFKESEVPEDNREAWDNFVSVARESYEYLAANLDGRSLTPQGASAQAAAALQRGLRRAAVAPGRDRAVGGGLPLVAGRRRRIVLRRGDRLTVIVR